MNAQVELGKIPSPTFPNTVILNKRVYFWRSEVEHYKAQLVRRSAGLAPAPYPQRPEGDSLVHAWKIAKELGVCSATVLRRRREAGGAVLSIPAATLMVRRAVAANYRRKAKAKAAKSLAAE
jgi:hypothetical protein